MSDSVAPIHQDCAKCGALIDVTDEDPFALMHCVSCGAAMRVRTVFGNFELQEMLGSGGMGAVYRALDLNLHREVAIKLLRKEYSANPEFIRLFAYEASVTALINHPNVVRVYSSGSDHGLFYLAMELVDKGSLDDLMTSEEKVSELQVLDVGIQIARGLNAALERGLIHRDVKPGNILFGERQTAKIVDFGLAVPIDQAGTLGGEIWATPYYVAPEKLNDRPEDFRSDLYSLASSLFHAVTGKPPYDADEASIATLREVKSKPVSLHKVAPHLSGATAYVIDRAMKLDPDDRWPSYAEFIDHLEYAKSEVQKKAMQVAREERASKKQGPPKDRNWSALGMAAALVIGGGALFLFQDHLFGPSNSGAASTLGGSAAEKIGTRYESARQSLIAGKFGEAATAFKQIAEEQSTPQPLRNWAIFHSGLATTLDGKTADAAGQWQKLIAAGPFSPAPEDQKLVNFFVETAKLALDSGPVNASIAAEYSPTSYEPLALFTLGAKNLDVQAFESAGALMTAYRAATPERGNAWVNDYKPLADDYLADLAHYGSLIQIADAAKSPEALKAALPALRETRGRLKLAGRLTEAAEVKVNRIASTVAIHEEQEARRLAEAEANDARQMAEVQAKANAASMMYKFTEARALLQSANVSTEKGKQARDAMIQRVEWLNQFKVQLAKDVSALGYPAPVQKRTGAILPGALSRATETQLELKSQYGTVPVLWSDLSYDSILQMGRSYIRADIPTERQIERKWLLGVFAIYAGKVSEGQALLAEASQAKPEYRDFLKMFPEISKLN